MRLSNTSREYVSQAAIINVRITNPPPTDVLIKQGFAFRYGWINSPRRP